MANLLLDYTALDAVYNNGKFRFIAGDNAAPSIADPVDTDLQDIDPTTDEDPVLFSYLSGSNPNALLVNITTEIPAPVPPPVSTGKYTICVPTASGTSFTWDYLRGSGAAIYAKDISLKLGSPAVDVAGNPHGIVTVTVDTGDYLYIVEYDSAKIYRVKLSTLQSITEGGDCHIELAADATSLLPDTYGLYHHGAAFIALNNGTVKYVYALFTSATNDGEGSPDAYELSTVVRYQVRTATGELFDPRTVRVGKNATALIPVGSGATASILVPAIGGKQNYGNTNGTDSSLTQVANIFAAPLRATIRITGDNSTSLSATGNYDIMGFAVSANGNNAYILLVTYDAAYKAYWRLYKGTLANILAVTDTEISDVTTLTSVANDSEDTAGYYWEILYDNTVTNGRLWFLKGTPIRVSAGNDYGTLLKDIPYPFDGSVAGNVNSADLIGEMLYQAAQGVGLNTRFGTTKHLARAVQAAKAAAEEEENK
jgi:hypothetical protein